VDKKGRYHLKAATTNFLDNSLYDDTVSTDNTSEIDIPHLLPVNLRTHDKVVMTSMCGMRLIKDKVMKGSANKVEPVEELMKNYALREGLVTNCMDKSHNMHREKTEPAPAGLAPTITI